LQAGAHVGPALGTEAAEPAEAAAGSLAAAARAAPAEHLAEDVGQVDVLALGPVAAAGAAPAPEAAAEPAHGLAPVGVDLAGVELAPLLGVPQQVEGRADPLELLFGGLVARVGVGVVLLRQGAERLADLLGACATGDA